MAVIASSPFYVKATIKIGEDDYTGHFSSFELVATPVTAKIKDVSGKTYQHAGDSEYSLNVGVIQDWTATGLARLMYTTEGTEAEVEITTEQVTVTANVTLVAPSFGGAASSFASSSVTLPVTGKPTLSPGA